jgi:putative chitinase
MGYGDHADPNVTSLLGDTPGTLGYGDHADPTIPWCSVNDAVTRLPDGTTATVSQTDPIQGITGANKMDWQKLKKAFPAADDGYLQKIADELNKDLAAYGLDSRLRQAHFFAQVREEGGAKLEGHVENLNYSPDALKATFKYYRDNPEEAKTDGYTRDPKTQKITKGADQETVANKAYGGRLGNGDEKSGDGWRYRGRGFMQVTGKDNYTALNATYTKYYSDKVDFVANPELLEQFPYNVRSAVCFWNSHGLPKLADAGDKPADVDAITAVVNKHTKSYAARRSNFVGIYAALA